MAYRLTAITTLLMLITYLWTGVLVGKARSAHAVKAPATEGPDAFNRVYRAHVNTLEQLALMVPALWIFATVVGDVWAGALGLVWIAGRVMFVLGYAEAAEKREMGFGVTFVSMAIAIVGGLGGLIWGMIK